MNLRTLLIFCALTYYLDCKRLQTKRSSPPAYGKQMMLSQFQPWILCMFTVQLQVNVHSIDADFCSMLTFIEPTNRSCGYCGTNLVPYPLSTRQSCGDPLYSAFFCNNETAQLYFKTHKADYRVTNINPYNRTFTIQGDDALNCTSSGPTEINQQLNQSSPFSVSSGCIGGQNDFSTGDSSGSVGLSEVKIEWSSPKEPLCNSSKDCDWLHATCDNASDGTTRCLCDSGFSWSSFSVNCSLGENVDLMNWPATLATVFMNNGLQGNVAISF